MFGILSRRRRESDETTRLTPTALSGGSSDDTCFKSNSGHGHDPLIPPRAVNYNLVIPGSDTEYVAEFKREACLKQLPFVIRRAGLAPDAAILDFGCGLGRFAYAASKYLSPEGRYFGHDINPDGISFLKRAYALLPNFAFHCRALATSEDYVAISQSKENQSSESADGVDLNGFVTRRVDAQWSCSVFTHMWPEAIVHVLDHFRRLVKPGGLCVNTWLVVDDFAAYVLRCGLADRELPGRVRGAWTLSTENPLACTAYEEAHVRQMYEAGGHDIVEILPGSWAGRENGVIYQDVIVSRPRS